MATTATTATMTSKFPVRRVERSRRPSVDFDNLPFGSIWSDHMFVADNIDGAWTGAEIRPYGPMEIYPSSKALQYAVSMFEGFKAHKTPEGDLVVFRPDMNQKRFNRTASRFVMPELPEELFFDAMRELLDVDRGWLPDAAQGALYIRPSYFGTDPTLNVTPGRSFRFVLMTTPVGLYFTGSQTVSLVATRKFVRAFPGGTGAHKPAANYGPTMLASVHAQEQGYDNVIWLDGHEGRFVEECGVMNMWFVIDGTAITPPLEGTILPGVTRDSLIQLCADFGIPCEERRISVEELLDAHAAGTFEEAFGSGTAATVQPIDRLGLDGTDVTLPQHPDSVAARLKAELYGIQTGRIEDRHGWLWRP
ncbi:branched-chain amino acid aminotransferase [Candidatus Palauibacter sp.]|uniref:branched-chain amino acid aminotransferase n=1 Tax=Candidatus Palauibacter sp. TaxID=3101350 RepID=UPI003AF1E7AF